MEKDKNVKIIINKNIIRTESKEDGFTNELFSLFNITITYSFIEVYRRIYSQINDNYKKKTIIQ